GSRTFQTLQFQQESRDVRRQKEGLSTDLARRELAGVHECIERRAANIQKLEHIADGVQGSPQAKWIDRKQVGCGREIWIRDVNLSVHARRASSLSAEAF